MLDYIFSGIASLLGEALDGLLQIFLPLLDFSFDSFNNTFPYAAETYSLIQAFAISIALLIAAVQLIPFFFGTNKQNETPLSILLSAGLSVFGIFYGNYIFTAIMEFAQKPFDALRVSDNVGNLGFSISFIISEAFYAINILLYILVLVAMGIALLRLMLEIIERYVFLFVLVYLSPLASASLASKETSGIFAKYFSMFISQCFLFVLNIWFLKMFISMLQSLSGSPAIILGLTMGYAMLRIATKIDSYLNQIGLNTATVGMGNELMGAFAGLMAMGMRGTVGKKGTGNAGINTNPEDRGGILGIADKVANTYGKVSPISMVPQAASNAMGGFFKTTGQAWEAAKDAAYDKKGFAEQTKAGFTAGKNAFMDNFNQNQHDAWNKTKGENLWARHFFPGTDPGFDDIAKNSFMADKVFTRFENSEESNAIERPDNVAAILQGIGFDQVDKEAQDVLNVGYGNVEAENVAYRIDNDGINAQYEKDGWKHDWQYKNASQYSQLPPQKQQAYTAFKSSNGMQYYYAHNKSRVESPITKAQANAMNQIEAFGSNPLQNSLDANAMAMLRKDPGLVNELYNGFGTGNVSFDASTAEGRRAMADMLSVTPVTGNAFAGKKAAMDALAGGAPINTSSCNSNGMELSWTNAAGESYAFSIKTPAGTEDPATLMESGYASFDMGSGSYGWAKYTTPPTQKEVLTNKATAFVSNPDNNIFTPGETQAIFKDPEITHSIFTGLVDSGERIHIEPNQESPHREFAAGMVANLRMEGVSANDRNIAAMAIMAGQARFDLDGRGFSVEYNASENEGRQISMITPSAVKGSSAPNDGKEKYDYDNLANQQYNLNTINGENFYTICKKNLPPVNLLDRSTNDHY